MIQNSLDPVAAWDAAKKRLARMSPEERVQTLVQAGILTRHGNVAKPYRRVIRPIASASGKAKSKAK